MSGFARGAELARGQGPLVYGHRGTRTGYPENTLLAMRRAIEQGADGIELDVRVCGSGEVVVLHDPDLMRVAGVPLSVAQAGLPQLRAHDLGQGERVPLLDEAIDLVLGAGKVLNVECKPDVPIAELLIHTVLECVRARTPQEQARILFSSFSAEICRKLAARLPAVKVALLFDRVPTELPAGIAAVHPHHSVVTPEAVASYAQRGLLVNVWTVNDAERAAELAAVGVDGIITDDVPLVLGRLGR